MANIENIDGFIETCKRFIEKKEEVDKQIPSIGKDFNIFTAISDQYKKENLHSDILKIILESKIQKDDTHRFLKLFLDMVGITDFSEEEIKNANIEREGDRLDLFIYSGNKGIIIENKINGAPDQEQQIQRYYKAKKEKGDKVKHAVYLTLNNPNAKPYDYDNWDKNVKNNLSLISIAAVESTENTGKTLVKWLDACIKSSTENSLEYWVLTQYKELLQKIGRDEYMKEEELKLTKVIYGNKDLLFKVQSIVGGTKESIETYLFPAIREELKKEGYTIECLEGYECLCKAIDNDNSTKVFSYCSGFVKAWYLQVGYYNSNGKVEKELKKYLKEKENTDGNWKYQGKSSNWKYLEKDLSWDDCIFETLKDCIKDKMEELENAYKQQKIHTLP